MILAQLIDLSRYVPLAMFGTFAAMAWWLLELFAAGKPKAEQRLEQYSVSKVRQRMRESSGGPSRKSEVVARLLEKASQPLAKPLQPKTETEVGKLKMRLVHAGFRGETAPSIYLGAKIVGLLVGITLGGGGFVMAKGVTQDTLVSVVVTAGVLFYVPDLIIYGFKKKRREAIFLGLPDALDLMVVCVEAGLGLDQAMRKVSEEMKKSYPVIADEFGLCNFQLQMGLRRTDVLRELGYRTGVDDVRSLTAILIQADKFGSSIAQALRVQSESMRTRRRQLAEEKAAKTAVKLIFPLVMFIFPAIFVVLVGPAAITIVNEMFPAMRGG